VCHDRETAIGRDADFVEQSAPVRQRNFLRHLARREINDAHARRDDIAIRPARVEVICHEQPFAIGRDCGGERFARHGDAPEFLLRREIEDAHVVVKSGCKRKACGRRD